MRIKEDLRVVVIGDHNTIEKGTVRNVYYDLRIAIVDMDNGATKKVSFDRIGIDESKTEPEKVQEEPREREVITITPDEFREISWKVVEKETKDKPATMLAYMIFLFELHRALFFDAVDND